MVVSNLKILKLTINVMNYLLSLLMLVFAGTTYAQPAPSFDISTNDYLRIGRELKAYDNSFLDVKTVLGNGDPERARLLIGFYLVDSNAVSTKSKLPIAGAFAELHMYTNNLILTKEYLASYSNDWQAWDSRGDCAMLLGMTNEGYIAYKNAAKISGRDYLIVAWAGAALLLNKYDEMEDLLPTVIKVKNSKDMDVGDRTSALSVLLAYSLFKKQKNFFIDSLKGFEMKDALTSKMVVFDIKKGIGLFKGQDPAIDQIEKAFLEAQSNSSTQKEH